MSATKRSGCSATRTMRAPRKKNIISKGNLEIRVTLIYEKNIAEVETTFSKVLTVKGKKEFYTEYGVRL